MEQNLILIGMPASGKTTIAKRLAPKIGCMSCDSDELISFEQGQSVGEIIERYSISAFRRLEKECLTKVIDFVNVVISSGGGIVEEQQLMRRIKEKCYCIYLYATPAALYRRLTKDCPRPLLTPLSMRSVQTLYDKREALYRNYADLTVDTTNKSFAAVVKEIVANLNLNTQN